MNKIVLVGEANPYGGDPKFALYPAPERSAGGRLCSLILGMRTGEYLRAFDRVNLCPSTWSIGVARLSAKGLKGRYAVLFGAKVCSAFDVPFDPYESQYPATVQGGGGLLILPHPSGLCRLWNEAGAYDRARRAILEFADGVQNSLTPDMVGRFG